MIRELYELATGRAWTTTRSAAVEFGPPPAAELPELRRFTDAQLMADGPGIVAAVRARRASRRLVASR
jgi:hypothetical protein